METVTLTLLLEYVFTLLIFDELKRSIPRAVFNRTVDTT